MKAFVEVVKFNVADVVTTSGSNQGGGTGGSKVCETYEGIPLE